MLADKALQEELNKFAKYVIQQSRSNLSKSDKNDTKALYNSLGYDIELTTKGAELGFSMEQYGEFQDKGVRGKTSTYPETSAALSQFQYGSGNFPKGGLTEGINEWMKKKRFQWRDERGRFMSYESMSYIIARSIYNKGLKANLFFTTPFELGLQNLPKQLTDAFSLDIENAIILGTKK